MAQLEYNKLNRVQKMAVFLIVIGQDAAVALVRNFADIELEAVCREMAKLPLIDDDAQRAALEEFSDLVGTAYVSVLGGPAYARRTLELTRDKESASHLLERVSTATGGSAAGAPIEALRAFDGMDNREVSSLLKTEQPQTIAFVLSHLETGKAGEILRMLEPAQRAEVVERLGGMEATSPEVVNRVVRNFTKRFDQQKPANQNASHKSGGAEFVAGLIKGMDKETSKSLLGAMQDRNPALTEIIRKKLFGFGDLVTLSQPDLQRVLREVDTADLTVALKSANERMKKMIAGAMSKRAAETLMEEIMMLGAVRAKEQEAAQDRIIAIVRRLEEAGDISLDQPETANAA